MEAMTIGKIIARLLLAALAVVVGGAMLQDYLLYFPEKATVDRLTSANLRAWPGQHDFRGLYAESAGTARGTAIVFHGNAGHAGHRAFYGAILTRLGLRVILAEYPGYGPRPGRPSERNLVEDAEKTIVAAHEAYGTPLLLVGESLGAAVAAAAGRRQREKVAGMWLITPWNSLDSLAAHHYPWLPVRWLLRDRYDNVASLASFDHPVVVTVAERDSIVPMRFGLGLYESLRSRKHLEVVKGADHNDWMNRLDEHQWREAIEFLLRGYRA